MKVWFVLALALVGCGSKTLDGTCVPDTAYLNGGNISGGSIPTSWTCSVPLEDATRSIAQCPTSIQQGAACGAMAVDTTNPNQPTHTTGPTECFACAGNTGTDWTCASSGWAAAGTYSCKP